MDSKNVHEHYDAVAEGYSWQYERENLLTSKIYPANYFRLQLLLNSFVQRGVKRILEVGVGEGTPLRTLMNAGFEVWGFDIAEKMVAASKENLHKAGGDPTRISWGDIQDPSTYCEVLRHGPFDALMAMGVMPHVEKDDAVIENIATLVRPGGTIFIEFRNKLFSLFTFNRYTFDFIMEDLLRDVDPQLKKAVAEDLKGRLRMDLPVKREVVGEQQPGYDAILSKFHNPFESQEMLARHGFREQRLLWYHYHPAMPFLAEKQGDLFRREAIRLERESSGWRGMFLCSAFVIEAVKA